MGWYFSLTPWLPLRLLALGWLAYAIVVSAFGTLIRAVALLKLILGVFGASTKLVSVVMLIFISPVGLALAAFPPVCYLGQLLRFPSVWRREGTAANKIGLALILLVGGAIAATAAQWLGGHTITWIADMNPCAASRAGVTGSAPPPACP